MKKKTGTFSRGICCAMALAALAWASAGAAEVRVDKKTAATGKATAAAETYFIQPGDVVASLIIQVDGHGGHREIENTE